MARPVPALVLADANAGRVIAVGAVRRGAAGADPFVAALVTFFLLGEALLELLHDFVPAAQFFDSFLVFLGEMQRADPAQPFLGDVGLDGVGQKLETFEDVGKDLVEAIEVALVFHERRPREIVEILDAIADDVGADGLEQRQVLFQRHRHFG